MFVIANRCAASSHRSARLAGVAFAFVAMVATLAACGADASTETVVGTPIPAEDGRPDVTIETAELVQSLDQAGYRSLASAVQQVGVETLLQTDDFTILVPEDNAFLALTSGDAADILSNPELLRSTLLNHIIHQRLTEAELRTMATVTTAGGTTLAVVVEDGVLTIGGAIVVPSDVPLGSGIAHTVDRVFVP